MFFTCVASRSHMYYVCGEHLLRIRVLGRLIRFFGHPIPVPKGGASVMAVRDILRRSKSGASICMFPEGKRSFHGETIPSSDAIGKMVLKSGCALVTYRIRGGYFIYPRWARGHVRKGHAEGEIVGIYSSKQLAGMTAREITDIINRDTYENAYETQREKMWRYKGRDLAAGMEHLLFICPRCGAADTIETSGDTFACKACGMKGSWNEYGFLEGEDLPFDNMLEWMRWIEPRFTDYVKERGEEPISIEEDIRLYEMEGGFKNRDILKDTLSVWHDRMEIGSYVFRFDEIPTLSMLFGDTILFTYEGTYYGLRSDHFRAWKCARLWHMVQGDTDDPTREI